MRMTVKKTAKTLLVVGGGVLIGVAGLLGLRFATYQKPHIHYHANFAVFINGQREEFTSPIYYTDGGCTGYGVMTPVMRAHMHDRVNNVVHVEDTAVTWGQFFENMWWSLGPDFIQKSDGTMYKADVTNKLHVYSNGHDYTASDSLANMAIKDTDRVLISFGNDDKQALDKQYQSVGTTAAKYDTTADPATCSGSHQTTTKDKLNHLL